jgi:hypothetical protein
MSVVIGPIPSKNGLVEPEASQFPCVKFMKGIEASGTQSKITHSPTIIIYTYWINENL